MKLLAAAMLVAGITSLANAQAHAACGSLDVSKGDIKIQSGQTKKVDPAPVGSKICSGDTIIAGKDSRAKLKMEDGNELNISPDSKIVLETYQFDPAKNKKKVLLNILQGKIRAATQKENMYNDKAADGQANTFQVKTKSAVAGVRGTDFLTGFDPKTNKSEVVTFKGNVEVGQPGPGGSIQNSVQVGAGQKTVASPGQAPSAPRAVPAKELEKANADTKAETAGGGGTQSTGPGSGTEKAEGEKNDDSGKKQEPGAGDDKKAGSDDKKAGSDDKKAGGDKQAGSDEKKPNADKRGDDKKVGRDGSAGGDRGSDDSRAVGGTGSEGGGSAGGSVSPDTARSPSNDAPSSDATVAGPGPALAPPPPAMAPPPPPPPMLGSLPPLPPQLPSVPVVPVIPVCEFCHKAIEAGPSRVDIKINYK